MKHPITFSIITPTLNADQFIAETIESVISQKGCFKIQYLIVDGGSSDETLEIIKHYKNIVDHNLHIRKCTEISIEIISETDIGMYDAIVKGFERVEGDLCGYINSDDIYFPNALATVLTSFSLHEEANWLTGHSTLLNEFGMNINSYVPFSYNCEFIRKGIYGSQLNYIPQECVFWRSNLLPDLSLSHLSHLQFAGDFYIWRQFAIQNQLYIVDAQLAGFRIHDNNKSRDHESYQHEFHDLIIEKLTILDKFKLLYHKIMWKTPRKLKVYLSQNRIHPSSPVFREHYSKIVSNRV